MFNDFLTEPEVYQQLEQFWLQLFVEILAANKQAESDWIVPYYQTYFSNGQKCMDGNPIFSAKSKITNKSIRVIQLAEVDWTEVLSRKEGNELVLTCSLTQHNLKIIKNLLAEWI